MTGDERVDGLWGEHVTPFLGWADTTGDFIVEVDRICGQLARLAAVRGSGTRRHEELTSVVPSSVSSCSAVTKRLATGMSIRWA